MHLQHLTAIKGKFKSYFLEYSSLSIRKNQQTPYPVKQNEQQSPTFVLNIPFRAVA